MQSNPGKIVTKYQFSSLLNQAWMLTITLANICSGFKKCGIYPFNPNAIDCGVMSSSTIDDHGNNSSGHDKESGMDGDDDGGGSAIDGDEGDNLENGNEFSAEARGGL